MAEEGVREKNGFKPFVDCSKPGVGIGAVLLGP